MEAGRGSETVKCCFLPRFTQSRHSSSGELAVLEADKNVFAVAAEQFSLYDLDEQYLPIGIETSITLGIGECLQIVGLNDCWIEEAFAQRLSPEQMEQLKAGEGCVIRNPIPMQVGEEQIGTTQIEAGTNIAVAGKEFPVLLSLNGYDTYFSVGNNGFLAVPFYPTSRQTVRRQRVSSRFGCWHGD